MRLAFSGQGRYPDYDEGYALYLKRNKGAHPLEKKDYKRVIRSYCKKIAKRLQNDGMADLPSRCGSLLAVEIKRKPQYRGKKFVGYGAMDWKKGHYDGKLRTFGIAYMPRRDVSQNMRALGFVANRRLFKNMKENYNTGKSMWGLTEFTEEMI